MAYEPPFDKKFGTVPINRFSGIPKSGILSGEDGAIFFSISLYGNTPGNEIDLDSIEVTSILKDQYKKPNKTERRIFLWGPNTGSITNDNRHSTVPKVYDVIATMEQIIPPGPTTYYRIP